ncbi:MAG: succinate dehydrogenase cytochrome b subunit [Verrucomicrobiota bacterium]|jgi:succinate dehydrogenase / fumarate reductase cytochrome b subunit|nr:succinate dehydrogenase cytochrome b subunit [Verrucomicrobiota bacterium]
MNIYKAIFLSSLGKKYIMGVTGLALFGFVIGHMLGNLQIFLGPEKINAYGALLKSMPKLLWMARLGLLACVGLHLWAAIQLVRQNRKARPSAYKVVDHSGSSFASRTMIWSGLIVLAFIIFHLFDFTITPEYTGKDSEGRHDIFRMVVLGFSNPLSAGWYIFANALLCFHLSHGVKSLFQSLGLSSGKWRGWFNTLAISVAWLVFVGNASIPVAVLLGFGKEALK